MGGVEEWAHKHSIVCKEILFFFEDGAKHKGQIKWIAERDGLPEPDFKKKSEVIALQCGDLLAWMIHMALIDGLLKRRYLEAMERLQETSYSWKYLSLSDPDRLPTILGVPLRDPPYKYEFRTVRQNGKRTAVVSRRLKTEVEQFKIDRKNDVIPEVRSIPISEFREIARQYDDGVRRKKKC